MGKPTSKNGKIEITCLKCNEKFNGSDELSARGKYIRHFVNQHRDEIEYHLFTLNRQDQSI